MNRFFSRLKGSATVAIMIVSAGVIFSSCLKNNNNEIPDVPAAGLMAFNLAPDQQSVVIRLSGNSITSTPLSYTNFNGTYQRIYTGEREVQAFDYPETSPLTSTSFNFKQDSLYSVFVVGADDKYRNIIAKDEVDSSLIESGKAFVRFVNAIPDSVDAPVVTISASGNAVVDETAAYTTVSDFKPLSAGEIAVAVKNEGSINLSRNITLQAGKVYTLLLIGLPGASEEFQKPQIKYIENGSVSTGSK